MHRRTLSAAELDKALREFQAQGPHQRSCPKSRRRTRRRSFLDSLVDCIENQLDKMVC